MRFAIVLCILSVAVLGLVQSDLEIQNSLWTRGLENRYPLTPRMEDYRKLVPRTMKKAAGKQTSKANNQKPSSANTQVTGGGVPKVRAGEQKPAKGSTLSAPGNAREGQGGPHKPSSVGLGTFDPSTIWQPSLPISSGKKPVIGRSRSAFSKYRPPVPVPRRVGSASESINTSANTAGISAEKVGESGGRTGPPRTSRAATKIAQVDPKPAASQLQSNRSPNLNIPKVGLAPANQMQSSYSPNPRTQGASPRPAGQISPNWFPNPSTQGLGQGPSHSPQPIGPHQGHTGRRVISNEFNLPIENLSRLTSNRKLYPWKQRS